MPKKVVRRFLLLSENQELKDQLIFHLTPFGATYEVKESGKATDVLLDSETESGEAERLEALIAKHKSCRITLISHAPFTPEILKTYLVTHNLYTVIPYPLSDDELKATVAHFFAEPTASPLASPELVARYRANALEKLQELYTALQALREAYDLALVKKMRMEAHKLSGSGASYGLKELGDACRTLDVYLSPLLDAAHPPPEGFVSTCERCLRNALFGFQNIGVGETHTAPPKATVKPTPAKQLPSVYVVSSDPIVQRLFAIHAAAKPIHLLGEIDPHQALDNIRSGKIVPNCLILEKEYPVDHLTLEDFLALFPKDKLPKIGLLVVKRDLASRIQLSEAQVAFFLQKPITDQDVQDTLDLLLPKPAASPQRALIVDDDSAAATILKTALESVQIKVEVLEDEKNLFAALQQFSPHVLFLDLGFETYSGYQILRSLRSDMTYRQLMVIVYTASRTKETVLQCNQWGVNHILFKPLEIDELKNSLMLVQQQMATSLLSQTDLTTGLRYEESFARQVEEISHSASPGSGLILVFIQLQDFYILKQTYLEAQILPLIRGLNIEAKLYFQGLLMSGWVAEDTIGCLLRQEYSRDIDLQFDKIKKNFFKDIQVYTPVEIDLHFHGGALCFSAQPEISYASLKEQTLPLLETAAKQGEAGLVVLQIGETSAPLALTPTAVLVDDDTYLLDLLVEAFQRRGFQVVSFSEGQAAIDYFFALQALPNKLILILDRILPDMDGLDILRKVRTRFDQQLKTIFLSSLATEQDVLKGMQEGAIDYIFKPFNTNILIKKAEALLAL